jgi:hypothetical protein
MHPLSSLFTTALIGLALIAGSVFDIAFAQDSTNKVKPCIGELCPPKAPREDMPVQTTEGANLHAQDTPSAQPRPRKKMRTSSDRSRPQYQRKKKTAFRLEFDRYQAEQSYGPYPRHGLSHELR